VATSEALLEATIIADLLKAIKPGDPATGGQSYEDLQQEARRAHVLSAGVHADLQDEMIGLFRGYAVAVGEAHARMEQAGPLMAERRRVRRELRELRADVERAAKAAIRQAYDRQFELGKRAGWNWRSVDPAEEKFLVRLRREEYVFVRRFLDDIEAGRIAMPIEQRATLYGNASQEAFWWGFLYADQSSDRYVCWVISDAEHCPDCLYLSGNVDERTRAAYRDGKLPNSLPPGGRWGNGVYSAQELARLGVVPQSGKLRCTTNCRCRLERVERPEGRPQGKLQRRPYRSLAPKPVQPRYEERRKRYEIKRVQRSGRVEKALTARDLLALIVADLRRIARGEDTD